MIDGVSSGPFVKWIGGKGSLLPQLTPLFPDDVSERRHVELFVGGGALFFARRPQHAILTDVNDRLIRTYHAVRDSVDEVIERLTTFAASHAGDPQVTYYAARERFNNDELSIPELAAHFIYLNKTCFNGLYRENKKGAFNAACGTYKNPAIADWATLRSASRALAGVAIEATTFEVAAERCGSCDFVYLDPPYEPVSRTASFTAYGAGGFDRDDQRRLASVFRWLDDRGCKVMLSNSDVPFIRELYEGFHIDTVQCRRAINCKGTARGYVSELVVRNYN